MSYPHLATLASTSDLQDRRPGLSVSDRPGTGVSGRRLSVDLRRQHAPTPIDRPTQRYASSDIQITVLASDVLRLLDHVCGTSCQFIYGSVTVLNCLNGRWRPICLVFGIAALWEALVKSAMYKLSYLLTYFKKHQSSKCWFIPSSVAQSFQTTGFKIALAHQWSLTIVHSSMSVHRCPSQLYSDSYRVFYF